jgi:hypothetical protein
VENVRELGGGRVRFDVRLHRRRPERRVTVEAQIQRRGRVRSTTGKTEPRLFVAVGIRVGPMRRRVELGLVDRKNMIYRMLLGRSALAGAFLVDAGRRFLLTGARVEPSESEEAAEPC